MFLVLNLVLVHKFAQDNDAFIEFHPNFFCIKDQETKKIIHQSRSRGGLYPLRSHLSQEVSRKQAFAVNKPSITRWHSRLGHPAFPIIERVLSSNKLPYVSENNSKSICNSCYMAKSHQLPYPISNSASTAPLDLVFLNVWGRAPPSIGRHSYYVSFIDDFTKYTWIYLLKKKSDVFQVFQEFQQLVERKFGCKIKSIQSDWGSMRN